MENYIFPIDVGNAIRRLRWLENQIAFVKKRLSSMPDGSLLASTTDKRTSYSHYESGRRTHIDGRNRRLAERLAQKEYLSKALSGMESEKAALSRFVSAYRPFSVKMMEVKMRMVKERIMTPEEYARKWQDEEYPRSTMPFGDTRYFTAKGEQVRSRIEVIIADKLGAAGLPYHYEKPVIRNGTIMAFPDFTILDPNTGRECIWEHFGMLDKEDYRKSMLLKIRRLGECGYVEGVNLVVTMESTEVQMDTAQIDRIIESILSKGNDEETQARPGRQGLPIERR